MALPGQHVRIIIRFVLPVIYTLLLYSYCIILSNQSDIIIKTNQQITVFMIVLTILYASTLLFRAFRQFSPVSLGDIPGILNRLKYDGLLCSALIMAALGWEYTTISIMQLIVVVKLVECCITAIRFILKSRWWQLLLWPVFVALLGFFIANNVLLILHILRNKLFQTEFVAICLFLFIPIYLLEVYSERILSVNSSRTASLGMIRITPNILFLFTAYYFWVIYPLLKLSPYMRWVQSHVRYALKALSLFPEARPELAILFAIIILALYYLLWVRRGLFRVLFSTVPAIALMMACYVVFYWDLVPYVSERAVSAQKNVTIVHHFETNGKRPPINHALRFPRALKINLEARRLYVSFGSIYGNPSSNPSLLSMKLDGSDVKSLVLHQDGKTIIRDFAIDPTTHDLYFSTWGSNYLLNRINEISLQSDGSYNFGHLRKKLQDYDSYDVVPQDSRRRVFLLTGQPPSVIRFNMSEAGDNDFTDELNLSDLGIMEVGSILHQAAFDSKHNLLYVAAVTGRKYGMLLEIDPDNMKLKRSLSFKEIVISLKIDPVNDRVILGCGLDKKMIEVERKTMRRVKNHPIGFSTIRNFIIDAPNDRIYLVNHLAGSVVVMNRSFTKTLSEYKVGDKPIGMDKYGDSLFVISTLGVVRIRLGSDAY